ncbi:UvrD-helicase domain-containing protein [Nocardiopsis synnemataformans]|uniref:UvrD-helicase domain-containing protein n=1 Tax=Nocardiopsis synnemataformans TaxID=61305 RepID=UPI003EBA5780
MSTHTRTSWPPTDEQQAVCEAAATGEDLRVTAGAGTGKTSALVLMARALAPRRGLCLVFGRETARELRERMPAHVTSSTAHALAYRALGYRYRERLDAPRVRPERAAEILGITGPLAVTEKVHLSPAALATLTMQMVQRFCYSADPEPAPAHAPRVPGLDLDRGQRAHLARFLLPFAERAWADLQLPDGEGGMLRHTPDHYMKAWALTHPVLDYDWIALDEAQDTNPVLAHLVRAQPVQQIVVGDSAQAIYGWRGAIDALETWPAPHRCSLTRSWRFGERLAVEANTWLEQVGVSLRLSGSPTRESTLGPVAAPDAILCRTNAGAMGAAMKELAQGRTVALLGGAGGIRSMAEAAQALRAGYPTSHPELLVFTSWRQVQDYVEDSPADAGELATLVRLVDEHGPDAILAAATRMVDQRHAQVVCGTAHRAKGAEWDTVRVEQDFREPAPRQDGSPGPVPRAEAMLAYVAVTRARYRLDNTGLAWIHDRTTTAAGTSGTRQPTRPRRERAPRPGRASRAGGRGPLQAWPPLDLEATYTAHIPGRGKVLITPQVKEHTHGGHTLTIVMGLHPLLAHKLAALSDYDRPHVELLLHGAEIVLTEEIEDAPDDGLVATRDRGRLATNFQGHPGLTRADVLDLAEHLRSHLTGEHSPLLPATPSLPQVEDHTRPVPASGPLDLEATYIYRDTAGEEVTVTPRVRDRVKDGYRHIMISGLHPLLADRLAALSDYDRPHVEILLRHSGHIVITDQIDDGPGNGLATYRDRGRLLTTYQGHPVLTIDHVLDLAEALRYQLMGKESLHVGLTPRPAGRVRADDGYHITGGARRSITRQDLVRDVTLFLDSSGDAARDVDPEAVAEAVVARYGLTSWGDLDEKQVTAVLEAASSV